MTRNNYPSVKNIFFLCLAFIGLSIVSELIAAIIFYTLTSTGLILTENTSRLISLFFTLIVYGLIIHSLIRKSYVENPAAFFSIDRIKIYVLILFLLLFTGSSIIFSEINYIFYYFVPMPDFLVNIFSGVFNLDSLFLSLLMIVIMPAFFEEILFRGFILFGLRKNHSAGKSIFFSALFFGLVHLNPWQFITAFLLGLIFGWIALKTRSIILPVAGHFLNNLLALISSRYFDIEINPVGPFEMDSPWLILTGLILAVTGIYLFYQYFINQEKEEEILKDETETAQTQ